MTSLKNKFREEFLEFFKKELFKEDRREEKWIKVSKEEDECIGVVVHNKEQKPLVILHTIKDVNGNKAFVCASDNGFRLLTKEEDSIRWNESPLPKELINLIY